MNSFEGCGLKTQARRLGKNVGSGLVSAGLLAVIPSWTKCLHRLMAGILPQWLFRRASVLICLAVHVVSFTYTLDHTYSLTDRFDLSEGWMYGSGKGPVVAPQGKSFVDCRLKIEVT